MRMQAPAPNDPMECILVAVLFFLLRAKNCRTDDFLV